MSKKADQKSAFKMELIESVTPNARCVPGVYTAINTDDGTQFIIMGRNMANLRKAVSFMKTPPADFKEDMTLEVVLVPKASAKLSDEI